METKTGNLPLNETIVPADQAAAADAICGAYRAGTPVYPIGGGTNLGYGSYPTERGIGLSTAGLNRVVDYPARDLTITVEAGVTLGTIAKRLAAEGQRLPVDVPYPERATIGGVVAVNVGGPRRYRWGTIREYVIGLTAIDGCGEFFRAGGRVVKNAAGYDLCRLLTGSLGTLGVIAQVTLMVKPLPETTAFVACDVPDFDVAERLLASLVQTQTLPSAIEFLAGPEWQNDPGLGPAAPNAAGRLVVGLEGTLAEVEWMISRLQEEWRQIGVDNPTTLAGTRADPLWERLTEFRVGSHDDAPAPLTVEINTLPSDVIATVRDVLQFDPRASVAAHAGSGVTVARFSPGVQTVPVKRPMVVLNQPAGGQMKPEQVWGPPRNGRAVMQTIKDRFDPKNILNRGRFVFADGK